MFHNYKHDEKDPTCKYSFEIHDVDISFVNGIRRVMLTDIPTPGVIGEIEPTVEIIKNIGGLHNEIIAHRIGLIPICVSEELYDSIEDNDMQIELNVKNNGIKIMNVDSGQIKGTMKGNELTNSQLSSLFPKNKITDSHVLITRLRSNEELHFKENIVKKTARYNSAFSPVSLANFFYIQNESNFKKDMSILDKERTYHKNKFGEATRVQFEIEPINFNISAKFLVNRCLDILIQKFKNISDKFKWNIITLKFLTDNFLKNRIDIYEYFTSKDIIQNDILNYSSGKFNKIDTLFGIKLIIRNELISNYYNIKTLFLILKEDKSLLLDSKFSKKTTIKYVLKFIFK